MRSHTDVASRNVTDGIDDGPGAGDSALTGGMLFPCRRVGAAQAKSPAAIGMTDAALTAPPRLPRTPARPPKPAPAGAPVGRIDAAQVGARPVDVGEADHRLGRAEEQIAVGLVRSQQAVEDVDLGGWSK